MTAHIDIDALRATLVALPPKASEKPTARDIINALAPELQVAIRERGYTYADLSAKLANGGLRISASTLGSYLRAAARPQGTNGKSRSPRRTRAGAGTSSAP